MLPEAPVDVTKVRLTYVCGTEFTVHNPTPSTLELTYDVANTSETGGITVMAQSDAALSTDSVGLVHLSHESHVIQAMPNGGKTCP